MKNFYKTGAEHGARYDYEALDEINGVGLWKRSDGKFVVSSIDTRAGQMRGQDGSFGPISAFGLEYTAEVYNTRGTARRHLRQYAGV